MNFNAEFQKLMFVNLDKTLTIIGYYSSMPGKAPHKMAEVNQLLYYPTQSRQAFLNVFIF